MTLVGKQAPDFTAKAVVGEEFVAYTLSENWKKNRYTILWFYPKDFTFVCPTELIAFDRRLRDFHDRECEIVAVSTDTEVVHLAWKNTPIDQGGVGAIQYPMVADVKKEVATAYDVLNDEGVCHRGLFLIDRDGIVRHALINDDPLGRSVDEAVRVLDALRFSDEHGQVCPADWHEGQPTITPTPKGSKSFFKTAAAQ